MPKTPPPPTTPPRDTSFTCDWGDCERETTAWRYSGPRLNESPLGWLPVCAVHAGAADAVTAHIDGCSGVGGESGQESVDPSAPEQSDGEAGG